MEKEAAGWVDFERRRADFEPPFENRADALTADSAELLEAAAAKIAAEGERQANDLVMIRSMARTMVSLVAEMAGHASHYTRPADAMTADNIEAQLVHVYNSKPAALPAAFRQGSHQDDIERSRVVGAAVARLDGNATQA
jgi:hypothetical protein